jgi:NDP-sugar pyrophosphorylase family protein
MEAMVFAAGRGTRLAPLTDRLPKALVQVGGVALIERVGRRLVAAGATRLVVNLHPFAERVEAFLRERGGFGVEVRLSHEREGPLETGGGLLAAAPLFRAAGTILLHNVDVLTDLPLADLAAAHERSGALATLAVADRPSARRLLFDADGLVGRIDEAKGLRVEARPARGAVRALAFQGVHAVAPALLGRITERGVFSILEPYLRLAREGERILPFPADRFRWIDVGRSADLERARAAPP